MNARRTIQQTAVTDSNRMDGGTYSEWSSDLQDHTLYDTILFSSTLTKQTFFELGLGKILPGSTVTKTLAHTNMSGQGSRLPAGQRFLVKGFTLNAIKRVVDSGETEVSFAAAVYRVLQASNFRLKFPGRDFDNEFAGDTFLPTIACQDVSAAATGTQARTGDFLASKLLPLRNQIVIGDVKGSPVDFGLEWFVDNQDEGVAAALTVLAGGATKDGLKIGLVGSIQKLK